ncbi:hypothetical protein MRX96_026242 [Rhipicephalus microplus]
MRQYLVALLFIAGSPVVLRNELRRLGSLSVHQCQSSTGYHAATSISYNVNLASLGSNVVTFSLGSAELREGIPTPKPVEEPTPPSTKRIALGTLLVIVVVSATTLTLGWLDWPFLPGNSYAHQRLSKSSSTDAHRHGQAAVPAAAVVNDTIVETPVRPSAAKAKKVVESTIVPHVRTSDSGLDYTSSFSAEDGGEREVTLDEAFTDSSTAALGTEA